MVIPIMSLILKYETNMDHLMTVCRIGLIVSIILTIDVSGKPNPTPKNYNQSLQLDNDGKYMVYWKYNDTHITFEVHVDTLGYVGFGLSPNGKMFPADVVVGWIKDGEVHFSDRHTTDHAPPAIDSQQDWTLLHGEENDHGTILRFVRKLDTCDRDDLIINDQTVRLIYSYHPDDPLSERQIVYHGSERRGTKSVSLLSSNLPPPSFNANGVKILEFRNRNYFLPDKSTTYLCTGFQLPDLGGKHHIIEFEPIFTPGNEQYVHHLDILKCRGSHENLDKVSAECLEKWPENWPDCPENLLAWGTGGGAFYFPDHIGNSIGDEDDPVFYVMQLHYNNPNRKAGVIDSSGIRLRLTSNLRQYDVGNIMLGHAVTDLQIIPPHETAYLSRGYCAEKCITTALRESNVTEAKVVAVFQHAHLLGVSITTRHFRNGTELSPIIHDPYYDFFFQEVRTLRQEVTIKQGDSFIVECTYNSTSKENTTYGGASTLNEMCLSYLYVYPRLPLMACVSTPTYDAYNTDEFTLRRKLQDIDWKNPVVMDEFRLKLANSSMVHVCEKKSFGKTQMETYKFKEHTKPLMTKGKRSTGSSILYHKELPLFLTFLIFVNMYILSSAN